MTRLSRIITKYRVPIFSAFVARLFRINEKSRYYGFIGFGMLAAFAMAWRMSR